MKKILKLLGLAVLVAAVAIQFARPGRNAGGGASGQAVTAGFAVPAGVLEVITTSCFDCHSNSTRYPWYAEVQPVGWWLAGHIADAKAELNFDEFSGRRPMWQFKKFTEIEEQITEGEMPLGSYTLLHRDAILSAEQKSLLIEWTRTMRNGMRARYPADSLQRQRPAP